jgi:hypothetical protein
MIKRDYYEFGNQKQREDDRTISIFSHVKPEEWLIIPNICTDFFNHFDVVLSVLPMLDQDSKIEIWFVAVDQIDLTLAESFLDGTLARYQDNKLNSQPDNMVKFVKEFETFASLSLQEPGQNGAVSSRYAKYGR